MQKKSNEKDSFHWLVLSATEQNFNLVFHQGNEMICTAELNTHCFSWCGRNPKTSYGADVLRLTFHRESATDSECSLNCQAMCSLPQPYLLNRLWIDLNMIFSQRPYFFALHRHFPQVFCERYRFLNLKCSTSLSLSPGIAGRCNITF